MKHLTYPADVRHMVGEVVGPDQFRTFHRAVTAELVDGGKTRVRFRILNTPERAAIATGEPMPPLEGVPS